MYRGHSTFNIFYNEMQWLMGTIRFKFFFERGLYSLYHTIVAMILMITVGISMMCLILFTTENMKEVLMENSFLLFTLFNAWVKALIILLRRKDIKSLLKVLLEDSSQPLDSEEHKIQSEFDKKARKLTLNYSALVGTAVTTMYLAVFSEKGDDERIKILNTWRPYDLKITLFFWITWIHEFVGYIITASVHIAADVLIPGLMIQLCCQLKFLRHRLNNLPHQIENIIEKSFNSNIEKRNLERYFISAIVRHHNIIYQFANKLKQTFEEIIMTQFVISLIVICFCVYKITKVDSVNYLTITRLWAYAGCMLTELFLYCWYGNALMLYSSDIQEAIPETNWLSFERGTKKSLLISMIRSDGKPILISAGSVIKVNLNSFVSILKASYSAYNVLKDSI